MGRDNPPLGSRVEMPLLLISCLTHSLMEVVGAPLTISQRSGTFSL